METWKEIIGYEGLYEVSNLGKVRSVDRLIYRNGNPIMRKGKELSQHKRQNKYFTVSLSKDGKQKTHTIHRLVAIAFVDNPKNLPVVNHKDTNKENNRFDNLEWATQQENLAHADDKGLLDHERRINSVKKALTKVSPEDRQWIKDNYIPKHPQFGTKALAERFGVSRAYISYTANPKSV
ncbi:HNH endonuclease [Bacillus phage vB_BanS-Thrax5]|nr:HNH endonuclease [Bacillus phage vB_BanS-Thrax5]